MKRIWLSLLLLVSPAHARAQEAPACASILDCIAILRDYEIRPPPAPGEYYSRGVDLKPIERAVNRLMAYGEPSVAPLVELLKHPNVNVRVRAAYVLNRFPRIDARHLPALIAAHESVGGWLNDVILASGENEGLDYLWRKFLREARADESSGLDETLSKAGPRLYPRLEGELARCVSGEERDACTSALLLGEELKPRPDFVAKSQEAIARSPDIATELRSFAEDQLIRGLAPYGLTVLLARMDAVLAMRSDAGGYFVPWSFSEADWYLDYTPGEIGRYGEAAVAAGPKLVELLARKDMPDGRADAALALSSIGYRAGAAALLAEAPTFEDDWLFAYNAVESLARLGLQEARPVLQRVAETHWNHVVRANAQRALNMLGGGAFDRPDVAGDTAERKVIFVGPLGADLRYAGDWIAEPQRCRAADGMRPYGQLYAGPVQWPEAGGVMDLAPEMPELARGAEEIPWFSHLTPLRGEVRFVAKLGAQTLIGMDEGEFGGDVFVTGGLDGLRRLVPDNANAVFVMGEKVMVVTGLSHLSLSRGQLWVIGLKEGRARVERRVRLPVEADGYALVGPDTLVIRSVHGDVGVRADGALVDVRGLAACAQTGGDL